MKGSCVRGVGLYNHRKTVYRLTNSYLPLLFHSTFSFRPEELIVVNIHSKITFPKV